MNPLTCKSFCKKLPMGLALLALVVLGVPAFGQAGTCMQDEYNAFNRTNSTLVCTANDVSVAAVTGVNILNGGITIGGVNSCLQGAPFTFVADFEILTTSSKTRSNIGLYFGTGQSNALTGTCSDAILTPQYTCPGTGGIGQPTAVTCGDAQYEELDGPINGETAPNGCGDTSSSDSSPQYGAGTQAAELEVGPITCPSTTVACPAGLPGNPTTCMALPECTSWWQPASGVPPCSSPTHAWVSAAIPGTKSKCSCTTLYIPVTPIKPTATVAKSCNTTLSGGAGLTNCDAGKEGSTVTYHVAITNTTPAGEGGITVDQICDNRYGNVFTANGYAGTACPAGTVGSIASTTCSALDIANGATLSCDFTAAQGENASVTNTVTVNGHADLSSSAKIPAATSNTVTVKSEDAPSTATTNKGLAPGPIAACVTVRYNVTVANNSGADETETLNSVVSPYTPALNDSAYGDITQDHGLANVDGTVTGTTCGVATTSPGLGTLSGSSGAGAFPQTLAVGGGSYVCQFDGVICGTPAADAGTGCAHELQKPDTVTANLTGDDPAPNADSISQTDNQFTAKICMSQE